MYDLALLRDSGQFNLQTSANTRLALVHLSFRATSLSRGVRRQSFAAQFPGLGLLNLAHALRTDAAIGAAPLPEMKYFDDAAYVHEKELAADIRNWLTPARNRIIAATAYTPTIDRLERFLADFDPGFYLIIVGGPHATVAPKIGPAHIVVRGEGGAAMRHILSSTLTPAFGRGVGAEGICFVLDGKTVLRKQTFDRSLATLPSPGYAYDLLPTCQGHDPIYVTNFTRMVGERPQVYVCTQSCRARCTFCSTYLIHGRTVARPIEAIREDLRWVVEELKYDSIEFHDDDLAQHPDFTQLLQVLADLDVPWFCYLRTDVIDNHLAREMSASGCRRVFLGVESMDQSKLDYFRKGVSVVDNKRAVEALSIAGIGAVAGFIIGAPNDTIESIISELRSLLCLPLFAINCSILSPDPGTVEFQRALKRDRRFRIHAGENLRIVPDIDRFGLGLPTGLPTVCKAIGKKDLNRLLTLVDATFYFRRHIWEALTEERTASQVAMVSDYYSFVAETVKGMDVREVDKSVRRLRDELLDAMNGWYWRTSDTRVEPSIGWS
jgi:radical SAM superfamily enzyme YgiQ (UPF0313 family)